MKAKSIRGVPDVKTPCKDCEERHPLCHAECERYMAYKAEAAEIKKKKNEFGRLLDTLNEGEHRRMSTRRRKPE